jgi:hypothetical protein
MSRQARLASFRGPSTPNHSPVQQRQSSGPPSSPQRVSESTYHRKTRELLLDLRKVTHVWDELVLIDGLNAAKTLVDTRTELECASLLPVWHTPNLWKRNSLSLIPDRLPRTHLVGTKLAVAEQCISDLDAVIDKLVRVIFAAIKTVV